MKNPIKIGGVTVPSNLSQKEILKFLVENKALAIAEKKAAVKFADPISVRSDLTLKYFIDKEGKLNKAATPPPQTDANTVMCVINTTNWMDSHSDVHMPGIWNKSLKDSNTMLHLQEHDMCFIAVISDESKGYTEKMTWKDLGVDVPGTTEALIFATPLTGRNPYMEDQYRKGFVKNHSVGMSYVSLKLCVNEPDDEYFKQEYANWVQYAPMVANITDAENQGFFWAVLEAKVIEGSAVVKGSNAITPTIGFKSQPSADTETKQPSDDTVGKTVNWDKIANFLIN
jgi:hypothetical protein